MPLSRSRVTAQGQISIPSEIRRKPGIGPGSVLELDEDGANAVVRRSGRFTSEDIHKATFGDRTPRKRSLEAIKEGIRRYVKRRHARGLYQG